MEKGDGRGLGGVGGRPPFLVVAGRAGSRPTSVAMKTKAEKLICATEVYERNVESALRAGTADSPATHTCTPHHTDPTTHALLRTAVGCLLLN